MSDLEALIESLIESRDSLLDWVAANAPVLHVHEKLGDESRIVHRSPFGRCDDEPCDTAHEVMSEAYRVMEGVETSWAAARTSRLGPRRGSRRSDRGHGTTDRTRT